MTLKIISAAALAALVSVPASAAVLDFESEGYAGNVVNLGNDETFGSVGITFSSSNGLFAVKTGTPQSGFAPDDNPLPLGIFDDYFLTSNFGTVTELNIKYDSAVTGASFDLADIDGLQDGAGQQEIFTFDLFNQNVQVGNTRTIKDGDPGTGDRNALTIGLGDGSMLFDEIRISGTTAGGTRRIGIAFDNFITDVNVVPLPAAGWMLLAGIGGLGVAARRKNRKSA